MQSIYYDEDVGIKIAEKLGYSVKRILSDPDENITGHVYELTCGRVMKIGYEPDFNLLHQIKDKYNCFNFYHIGAYIEPYKEDDDDYENEIEFSVYIRDPIDDIICDNKEAMNECIRHIRRNLDMDFQNNSTLNQMTDNPQWNNLSEKDKNTIIQIYDAVKEFNEKTTYKYNDIHLDNFGVSNNKICIRDIEGCHKTDYTIINNVEINNVVRQESLNETNTFTM